MYSKQMHPPGSECPTAETEMKKRPEVTRGGNSSYSKVERSTYPLLELINFSCIIWQPDHRRFKWPSSTSKYCVFMLGLLWCASVSVSV